MKGDVIKNTCSRVPCIPIGPPMAKNVRYRAEFAANAVESGRICGYTYIDQVCAVRDGRVYWQWPVCSDFQAALAEDHVWLTRLKDVTYAEDSLLSRIRERMQLNVRCDNEVEF